RFPCNNCGSDLRFDPGQNQMMCDHCGNTEAIDVGPWRGDTLKEIDFRSAVAGDIPEAEIEETRVVACPDCGAQTEFNETVHAVECPFCATPVVTDTGLHRHIKPKGLLPFGLDERAARAKMTDWLGSLWFAPNGLQDYARKGRQMSGIYVPYWTFDADTKSQYSGQRGTHYYETRTVTRKGKTEQVRVQKTRWHGVQGRVARFFDDVLVLGSQSLPKKYTDALEPWDLSAMEPYQPQYLAGFRAEGYQVELADAFKEARVHVDAIIRRDVKHDIGGDEQRVGSVDTAIGTLTFKHVLLPVWMAAYKYRGRTFRFVVNGRTGRVQGERPYSKIKIAIAVVCGLIVAGIVGIVIANSQ
ncbi:MAG: primosomal protein N' (replication factor Y) - superfamily II helicase, partial [Octadecabacter sp.]